MSEHMAVKDGAAIGLVAALAAVGIRCDRGAPLATSGTPIAKVVISPRSVALGQDQSAAFTAVGLTAGGDTARISITWTVTGGAITDTTTRGGQHYGQYRAASLAGRYEIVATSLPGAFSDTATVIVSAPPPGSAVVLVGAGDIAECGSDADDSTAALLGRVGGTIFTLGDNAYPDGYYQDYAACWAPSWGRYQALIHPAVGNHEYHDDPTSGAADYYRYFFRDHGTVVGDSGQYYYSYDLGAWHIVVLNSLDGFIDMSAGSPEEQWLRADLAASARRCTLAYMHYPRFSSGSEHGSYSAIQPLWQALYDYGAELVLAGHDHEYERFAPQTPDGTADSARGIREFVVGTGGGGLYQFGTPLPNSEVRNSTTWGVLQLTLGDSSYSWEFIPITGQTFTDTGSGTCH